MRTLNIAAASALALSFGLGGVAFASGSSGPDTQSTAATQSQSASSDSGIMDAQRKLASDGLYKGKVDGINGPMTEKAVKAFQKQNSLDQTGQLDQQTQQKIGMADSGKGSSSGSSSGPSSNSGSSSSSGASKPATSKSPQNSAPSSEK